MSLCSEHFKTQIQLFNLKPQIVSYQLGPTGTRVFVTSDDNTVCSLAYILNGSYIPVEEQVPMKLGGMPLACRCDKTELAENDGMHILRYLELEKNQTLKALHSHINTLFHHKPRIQLQIHSNRDLETSEIINDVRDSTIVLKTTKPPNLENFLTTHPNQENIKIEVTYPTVKWIPHPKLLSMDGLSIHKVGLNAKPFLDMFTGRYLILDSPQLKETELIVFIKKWKQNEMCNNLRALIVKNSQLLFNNRRVLRRINALKWDEARRPKSFRFDSMLTTLEPDTHGDIDCSSYSDIQQDDGGKWASIKVTKHGVSFFVWD
ncbi:hypothetical protein CRE_12105 [Caenorhabditis remanei]|uniref:F-box associated domain-containing protein n=1 Tax=Caenorhabditis remanei TaxID=31234 RepID=E3MPX6_CAERE|nr:hypothetical protein CRE_12105 [Caenorhabditis remanei]